MTTPVLLHAAVLLADMVVVSVWTGAALAAAVALALHFIPALPARVRSLLWLAAFGIAMILPVAVIERTQGTGLVVPAYLHLGSVWSLPLLACWIALACVRTFGLVRAAVFLRGVVQRSSVPVLPTHVTAWLATRSRLHRRMQVRTSNDVDRTRVVGYIHPTILLPSALLETISEDQLHQVLLHEAQHVRWYDDCVNLLQKFALALFPLSPALFWMERRLCLERELACDDAVLWVTHAPKAYAMCLTDMADRRISSRVSLLAVAAFGRQSELSRRVYRILEWPPREANRWVYGIASIVLVCGLSFGTVALERFGLPVAFGTVSPMLASADISAGIAHSVVAASVAGSATESTQSAHVIAASFHVPEARINAPVRTHVRAVPVKGHSISRPILRQNGASAGVATDHDLTAPKERLIEYTTSPVNRELDPVLQQIFLPYAVIPAGDVWLIVQL